MLLNVEDYRWHWSAFLCTATTGVYVFIYSVVREIAAQASFAVGLPSISTEFSVFLVASPFTDLPRVPVCVPIRTYWNTLSRDGVSDTLHGDSLSAEG